MQSRRPESFSALVRIAVVCVGALVATTCGGDDDLDDLSSDQCRLDPDSCNHGAGALCDSDRDCAKMLFCCDDDNNCGGGMCTAECKDDRDCPVNMLCEHDMCFYACESDRDCAETMTCEHDRTICEYD